MTATRKSSSAFSFTSRQLSPSPLMTFRNSNRRAKVISFVLLIAANVGITGGVAQAAHHEQVDLLITEAIRFLHLNDLKAAREKFLEATEIDSGATPAWLGLSEIEERQGALLEALKFARSALATDPESFAPHLIAGRVLAGLGDVPEALEQLSKARHIKPSDPDAYLISALLLRDTNRTVEAIDLLEAGRERGLNLPALDAQLGFLLLSEGESDRALRLAVRALGAYPDEGELYLVAGLALSNDPERREEAVSQLLRALEQGVPRPDQVHLELAELLMGAGRFEEAIGFLEIARQLLPDLPQVHYRLWLARRASGDLVGAQEELLLFQKLKQVQDRRDLNEKEIGTALNEAQALAAKNNLSEALTRLESLLNEHPNEPRTLTLQGKVLFSMQHVEEALASVVAARQLVPWQIENHYLEGLILLSLGRLEEARAAIQRSLTLDPKLIEAQALLGEIAYRQEDFRVSIEAFQAAMDLGLKDPTLRQHHAEALRRLHQLD